MIQIWIMASCRGGTQIHSDFMKSATFEVILNGRNQAAAVGGRHWIELPFAASPSRTVTNGGPVPSLTLLEQHGLHVTPLGPQTIDGRSCTGYAVTPTKQALLAAAQQDWGKLGLSTADTTAGLRALHGVNPPTVRFWFDSQQLACRADITMQIGSTTSAASGGAQMVMDFTNYGAPVHITPPAPSDTVSLQQLLQGVGQSSA